jgi:saccharopine dehydrogenase (NAD+, L-lysine forming)
MKSILILGAGEVGASAANFAAAIPGLDRIVIADISIEASERAAAQAGPKASAICLDVRDALALDAALKGHDAVLNFVGPYFRFARPVLEAAIQAKVPYLDVNDDWEPTLDLLSLNEQARQNGLLALIGIGASPGVSNVLAKIAMTELPDAEDLFTVWRAGEVGNGYSAAIEHWLHQSSRDIRVLRGGKMIEESPLRQINVSLPGLGSTDITTVGHPEPITLAQQYPQLQHSVNAMVIPPKLCGLLVSVSRQIDAGTLSVRAAADRFSSQYLALGPEENDVAANIPGIFALARKRVGSGWRSVMVVNHEYAGPGIGPVTSAPCVAALRLVLNGTLSAPGVHTPEEVLHPEPFFNECAKVFGGTSPIWTVLRS